MINYCLSSQCTEGPSGTILEDQSVLRVEAGERNCQLPQQPWQPGAWCDTHRDAHTTHHTPHTRNTCVRTHMTACVHPSRWAKYQCTSDNLILRSKINLRRVKLQCERKSLAATVRIRYYSTGRLSLLHVVYNRQQNKLNKEPLRQLLLQQLK